MLPPAVLAPEAFWKVILIAPRVASEASKVKSWTSGIPSGLPLEHPHPISVVEPGGTSVTLVSVRDRLSPTRKEKLLVLSLSTPPSRAGRDDSGRKKWCWSLFFLSYGWELTIPASLI